MYGTRPISRGLNSKRLILPLKGEVHDLFVLGVGDFGNPESGFPCASQGQDCLGDQVPGLRAGFGLGHSNSTLASLHVYA